MKNEKLFRAIGQIDDDKIVEAETVRLAPKAKCPPWYKWASVAVACLALVVVGLTVFNHMSTKDLGSGIDNPAAIATEDLDIPNTVTANPAAPPPIAEPADQDNTPAIGGGGDPFELRFVQETYNIYMVEEAIGWEAVNEWADNIYLKKSSEEMDSLPALYQIVTELGVSKESLIEVNNKYAGTEMYIDEYIIDALYDDVPTMREKLKNPLALDYNGQLYTLYGLRDSDVEFIKSIPFEVLDGYLNRIEAWCIENNCLTYQQETIDGIRAKAL